MTDETHSKSNLSDLQFYFQHNLHNFFLTLLDKLHTLHLTCMMDIFPSFLCFVIFCPVCVEVLDMEPSINPTGPVIIVDADGCRQEGSPVVVRLTADLKKPLTEDTLLL
ncbi:hypothetical protein AMECASPLE_030156 [Ameca splendens]|uniref:Uncharacterized protein n=1 Tax=Ameca splendens TaxID=208324 RepID=A0ABV0YUI3_9TELE